MSGKRSFLVELKRRNVLRAAALYASGAWLLVEAATQVLPFFHVADWVVRAIVVAAVAAFPIALVFSWFYEWTPDGIRRESEVDHSAVSPSLERSRRLDRWIVAALSLAVVLLLANSLVPHRDVVPAPADLSIAVLPFKNLSGDKSDSYVSDGIQEEILAHLAKIRSLKVISHTSTQNYTVSPDNVADVAHQLGVANVLEGSVEKSGGRVTVSVKLIHAASGERLWAQSYERGFDDVSQTESDVAQAIASALQITLSGGERAAMQVRPTQNPDAHDAYLRGLAFEARSLGSSAEVSRHTATLYAEATRIDPGFALAWARLAIVKSYMYSNFIDRTPAQLGEVKRAADTALRLQPDLGEAHLAVGYYRYRCLRDFDGALREFEQARQRLPNNPSVLAAVAYVERRQGHWRESITHLEEAIRLDPRETSLFSGLAINYAALRDFANARATLDRALDIEPDSSSLIAAKADAWLEQGNVDAAGKLLEGVTLRPADGDASRSRIKLLWFRRDFMGAVAVLEHALAEPEESLGLYRPYYLLALGASRSWTGDAKGAQSNFAQVVSEVDTWRQSGADDVHLAQILAYAQAGLGDKAAALREVERAVGLAAPDALMRPSMEIPLAQIQAYFGDADAALAALPHLLEEPDGLTLAELRYSPLWDPLRQDPRFDVLLKRDEKDRPAGARGNITP
ncbi:MAG: tetratricopeptide repeat protein [Rhodanobacteraceae bacterium]